MRAFAQYCILLLDDQKIMAPHARRLQQATHVDTVSSWYMPQQYDTLQWILNGTALQQSDASLAPYSLIDFDFREGEDESQPATAPSNVTAINARRSKISSWQAQDKHVIAYVPAGDWENYRRDYATLNDAGHLGGIIGGWPDEKWVNITGSHLAPVLAALQSRIAEVAADGFDGIEFDLVEVAESYEYEGIGETGFAVSHGEQAVFNRAIFQMAHDAGLFVVMKGYASHVGDFVNDTEMALMEEPFQDAFREQQCVDGLAPYVSAGKLVVAVHYASGTTPNSGLCATAGSRGWQLIFKNMSLNAPIGVCT